MAKTPALQQLTDLLRARPISPDVSWEERRRMMEEWQAALPVPPEVRLEPVNAAGVRAEWISRSDSDADRAILYLHGGGYALGSIATHRFLTQAIGNAAGARVLGIDYRLAPENPFPAAVEDAVAAWRWMLGQGLDPGRSAIGGDSAGGGLALAMLIALRDRGIPLPGAAALLSPWTDLTGSGASVQSKASEDPMVTAVMLDRMAEAYVGSGGERRQPLASPLFAELRGLPPMLIQVGSAEILLDDSTRLTERAQEAGVEVTLEVWDDMIHVFQAFPMLAEADQAIAGIGAFVRARTGAAAAHAAAARAQG